MKPNRPFLVVAALLAVAAMAVPAAGALAATHRPKAKPPLTEVNATRATLDRATSQLARIRRTIGSGTLQQQVLQLQRTLNEARAHAGAAAVGIRASSPFKVAVEQVRREVAYVHAGVPYSEGQLISEAAMDYVAGHVSDTAYGYLETVGTKVPRPSASRTLAAQAGICTGAAVTFAEIVNHFGLAVRSVNFYYTDPPPDAVPDGHVAVEVRYDGSWHFFDPTFGLFWTDASGKILSVDDVRLGQGSMQKNVAAFTNVFEDAVFGNDAWFITAPTSRLAYRKTKLVGVK